VARINDRAFVRAQYETEGRLKARKSAYANAEGDDPREFAFQAIAEVSPRRVLEVGGGEGEFAERPADRARRRGDRRRPVPMVEIQRSRGESTRASATFRSSNSTAANSTSLWQRGSCTTFPTSIVRLPSSRVSLSRVAGSSPRQNAVDHLRELWDLAGRAPSIERFPFRSENGEEVLRRHFARVERRDTCGSVTWDKKTIRRYVASWDDLASLDMPLIHQPLRARCRSTVFVAEKAA